MAPRYPFATPIYSLVLEYNAAPFNVTRTRPKVLLCFFRGTPDFLRTTFYSKLPVAASEQCLHHGNQSIDV